MAHFANIKIKGSEFYVVFTGSTYYLHSNFFGLVGIAERDPEDSKKFSCTIGNSHTEGGRFTNDVIFSAFKKHIRKQENQFIPCNVEFTYKYANLSLSSIHVNITF